MTNTQRIAKQWVAIDYDRGWTGYAGPFYSKAETDTYMEKMARGGIDLGVVGMRVVARRPRNADAR